MKAKPDKQYLCDACNVIINDWNKHCKTIHHSRLRVKSIFDPIIFDSHIGVKRGLAYSFLPKIPWKTRIWRVKNV